MLSSCLVVPVQALFQETRPARQGLGVVGLLALVALYAAILYAVATPHLPQTRRRWLWLSYGAVTLASMLLVAPLGPADMYTWAWLGGAASGLGPVVFSGWKRWPAVVLPVPAAVLVGAFTGGSLWAHAAIAASVGGVIVGTIVLPLWLWDLLLQAKTGREATARLAVSDERLRFARDVHDLLGHRLAVITLKAELAARLVSVDPDRAAQEAAEVQHLSATALAEVRETVHGYRAVDLDDQLQAVEGVLSDAGIRCTVRRTGGAVEPEAATQLALVLREGCTNVLRHSTARWCTIEIAREFEEVRMTMVNDGAGSAPAGRVGFGLRGTAERLAGIGGTLRSRRDGAVFTLDVTVPAS
ncbi:histidine kinase [Kribbella flavida DSM 17836]|uniref:Histidine kinase n=2 Tax=Kribbella flavida TaxID=182640 RepID=D2PMM8_KRIFD|nr:histidine kinase [Kribbella flavida DSM 17836]